MSRGTGFGPMVVRAWCAIVLLTAAPEPIYAADPLPSLHADPSRTSVSGLSSGAFMAVQFAAAYSSIVVGVGGIAGGPYNCAGVNPGGIVQCTSGAPSGGASWLSAQAFTALSQIDPTSGIARQRIYLFSGAMDQVVAPAVVAATRDFFLAAGVLPKNLEFVDQVPAGHAFISPSFGNSCGTNGPPFIDRCTFHELPYDQAREILQWIYGPLKAAPAAVSAPVRAFDQTAFAAKAAAMDATGYVFIPASCALDGASCAVHVVFHGCGQAAGSVGGDVYHSAGYNRWADSNRTIVLYPQVLASPWFPINPLGCWDWWGYTGPNYMVRSAAQMSAVKAMIDRLTGGRP